MDIQEITNTIIELENGDTTFDACMKLASLYIVRENLSKTNDTVVSEYIDILPEYNHYIETKRGYQLGDISSLSVYNSFKVVCKELKEFLQALYSSSDISDERELLKSTLEEVLKIF